MKRSKWNASEVSCFFRVLFWFLRGILLFQSGPLAEESHVVQERSGGVACRLQTRLMGCPTACACLFEQPTDPLCLMVKSGWSSRWLDVFPSSPHPNLTRSFGFIQGHPPTPSLPYSDDGRLFYPMLLLSAECYHLLINTWVFPSKKRGFFIKLWWTLQVEKKFPFFDPWVYACCSVELIGFLQVEWCTEPSCYKPSCPLWTWDYPLPFYIQTAVWVFYSSVSR